MQLYRCETGEWCEVCGGTFRPEDGEEIGEFAVPGEESVVAHVECGLGKGLEVA